MARQSDLKALLRRLFCAGGAAVLAVGAAESFAHTPAATTAPLTAITHHTIHLDGTPIAYTATVSEVLLKDKGQPAAIGTATAYVRDGVADPGRRPLIFFFNGGPGASSSPLHLAFGPRTVSYGAGPGAPQTLIDNPSTLLADADLVFIDPVGTGYSRPLPGVSGAPFWDVTGDATSVAQIIRQEIATLGRANSPHYLFGESYGGVRAATLLHVAPDIPFAGVMLLSPALDMTGSNAAAGNDLPYILTLPSYAAVAWRLGVAQKDLASAPAAFEAGERFAQTDYAAALFQGDRLDATTKQALAARLSVLIGVPTAVLLQHDLRLDVETFRRAILQDKNEITGRLNGSVIGSMQTYDKAQPPADDPAMSTAGRPSPKLTVDRYYRTELNFPAPTAPYRTLALDVNSQWRWSDATGDRFYFNVAPYLGEAMERQPSMRLFAVGGVFDLATPFGAVTYALNHAGAPGSRVRIDRFVTGHMIEDDPDGLAQLRADALAFIAPPPVSAVR